MRELEFLPSWYRELHRSRRRVVMQAWGLLLAVMVMGLWMLLAQKSIERKAATLDAVTKQLAETRTALRHLDEQTVLRQQLQQQHEVLKKLGVHVEAARVLTALDRVMPREMSLIKVQIETKEINRAAPGGSGAKAAGKSPPVTDRRLAVELTAVAPTNVDVANFLAELANVPFFDDVAPQAIEPMIASGHEMRKFDVSFTMNLNESGS
jgi:Tfp pilus assembly protein PilN